MEELQSLTAAMQVEKEVREKVETEVVREKELRSHAESEAEQERDRRREIEGEKEREREARGHVEGEVQKERERREQAEESVQRETQRRLEIERQATEVTEEETLLSALLRFCRTLRIEPIVLVHVHVDTSSCLHGVCVCCVCTDKTGAGVDKEHQ